MTCDYCDDIGTVVMVNGHGYRYIMACICQKGNNIANTSTFGYGKKKMDRWNGREVQYVGREERRFQWAELFPELRGEKQEAKKPDVKIPADMARQMSHHEQAKVNAYQPEPDDIF